jgi:hypothetical protein
LKEIFIKKIMNKNPKIYLDLQYFIFKRKGIELFRLYLKKIRKIKDVNLKNDLKIQVIEQFKQNINILETIQIKYNLKIGHEQLEKLDSLIKLSEND